ncbi:unnamed protein product [Symbiodinium sp. CCMP2592]|nr:unnamed protein product [Symbiodinium sp. CCMP2592]
MCRHKETRKVCSGDPRRSDRHESHDTCTWYCQEDAVPLTGVEGDYVAPAARDTYFQNEPNLIAPFDFDYDMIVDFTTKLRWAQFLFVPPCWATCLCCLPCFLQQNVEWETRSQHVALTIDGIRYVKEKRKTLCGLPCTDKGRESKTVPYDKITDCDVQEPAGTACCCCIENVLSKVHIDTASSGSKGDGVATHELELHGLVVVYGGTVHAASCLRAVFVKVWAMKRPGQQEMLEALHVQASVEKDDCREDGSSESLMLRAGPVQLHHEASTARSLVLDLNKLSQAFVAFVGAS